MSKRSPWTLLAAAIFAAIGLVRGLRALAIAPDLAIASGPDLPAFLFACVCFQAIGGLLAAVGLLLRSRRLVLPGLALFAISAVAQMAGDVAVYGVRSLLDGLAGSLLALAVAAAGWIAFEREAQRGGPVAGSGGHSSVSRLVAPRTSR